jgi:hypothetical protein
VNLKDRKDTLPISRDDRYKMFFALDIMRGTIYNTSNSEEQDKGMKILGQKFLYLDGRYCK